jgi:hypothetical protein
MPEALKRYMFPEESSRRSAIRSTGAG